MTSHSPGLVDDELRVLRSGGATGDRRPQSAAGGPDGSPWHARSGAY